jgi:hypothetical protein
MKNLLFSLIALVLGLCLAAVIGEALAIAYLTARDGQYISARDRFLRFKNTYIADATKGASSCRYVDTLFPHPYLGFVHHRNPPCGMASINNVGLFNDDFPLQRSADHYVILLTGGSVAAQLGQIDQPSAPKFLELALNEKFVAPKGASFKVLNGGDGAWKQPQQAILMLLNVQAVDAVVTLDGYNELETLRRGEALEYPANNFLSVNPLATESYGSVVAKWAVSRLAGKMDGNPFLSRSQAAYLLAEALGAWFQKDSGGTAERKTTVQSLFALPKDWDTTRRIDFGLGQYEKYMNAMNGIGKAFDMPVLHFIQPAPAIGKPLSVDEQKIVGDLSYGPDYENMTRRLLALNARGVTVYSLLDIYKDEKDTLYEDHIHLRRGSSGESRGYRLMAEAMAEKMGQVMSWKRR